MDRVGAFPEEIPRDDFLVVAREIVLSGYEIEKAVVTANGSGRGFELGDTILWIQRPTSELGCLVYMAYVLRGGVFVANHAWMSSYDMPRSCTRRPGDVWIPS